MAARADALSAEPALRTGTERLLTWCADIAGVALLALMCITVADVGGRQLRWFTIQGTFEISIASTVLIGFLAFPFSFLSGGHLVLDLFTHNLPARVTRAIDNVWYCVFALAFAGVAWSMWVATATAYRTNEVTLDLQLPTFWLWIPASLGFTLVPVACWLALRRRHRRPDRSPHGFE